MPSLFDIFAQAQNGAGMQALAQQFGLSMQQTQAAVEALLPAFSQGLQRNTADPYGLGAFMTAMASGQHAKYFEDATRAFSPQGINEGNGILGHLFGSKELSRAVASQAAQATGLSQQVLQQMLPAMASMMMGGLFKQTTNQMQAAGGFGGGGNPLGEIIEQMMRQAGGSAQQPQQAPNPYGDNPLGKVLQDMFGGGAQQPQSQPQQAPNPYGDNPLGKVLQDMFGGGAQQPQGRTQPQAQSPYGDNPLGKMFEEMLRQGGGGFGLPGAEPAPQQPQASQPRQAPQPQTNPSGRPRNPFDDIFGKMFETGAQQRDEYQKGMETIFDQFKRGMDRR
ncbi:DUF937 domain-containing protein [Mesorhizobium sp. M4B.F.Ca.ET.190.01.1.1]|uniref:DUF937 domain-containing protein n=1 Tax=unclassified Mesorhizobium TaxID=325217 RepID=UPI000FE93F99|nr:MULTISPECIES: DUF937 domain-containing protein [unclassified Mesorhizobium]RWF26394.1 MAG: DUF937 domain-containing protein [Mesorhizobium sp.]RWF61732.1 MAG: DUF937 domain-containing protein [Mesorhizobium sp.]TGQ34553.1 DUF937 domain-containing protein [Mesorhizobium sp. M4B.F.Ca.ET.214.01.1.1]TGQ58821.1 DUF937 domain-containing protein [Mesorhizobium sp. M4B.F.Ca.ET.211.01.1.1]TGR08320.1 DUF937 domain-containing protein [Mesorhizobium sp. M4B.F.Ca.ET.200.01.1.1]